MEGVEQSISSTKRQLAEDWFNESPDKISIRSSHRYTV